MLRDGKEFLQDMHDYCSDVLKYLKSTDMSRFSDHGMEYDAIVRKLELIGEAATHIPESFRKNHPGIPWRRVIALRNVLIHGYFSLDDDIIWSILHSDVPVLLNQLDEILER